MRLRMRRSFRLAFIAATIPLGAFPVLAALASPISAPIRICSHPSSVRAIFSRPRAPPRARGSCARRRRERIGRSPSPRCCRGRCTPPRGGERSRGRTDPRGRWRPPRVYARGERAGDVEDGGAAGGGDEARLGGVEVGVGGEVVVVQERRGFLVARARGRGDGTDGRAVEGAWARGVGRRGGAREPGARERGGAGQSRRGGIDTSAGDDVAGARIERAGREGTGRGGCPRGRKRRAVVRRARVAPRGRKWIKIAAAALFISTSCAPTRRACHRGWIFAPRRALAGLQSAWRGRARERRLGAVRAVSRAPAHARPQARARVLPRPTVRPRLGRAATLSPPSPLALPALPVAPDRVSLTPTSSPPIPPPFPSQRTPPRRRVQPPTVTRRAFETVLTHALARAHGVVGGAIPVHHIAFRVASPSDPTLPGETNAAAGVGTFRVHRDDAAKVATAVTMLAETHDGSRRRAGRARRRRVRTPQRSTPGRATRAVGNLG